MKQDKIYLVGFVGSGKTTVARRLGRRLGWRVEDIDDAVERREGAPLATIFERHGEAYFRAAERQVVQSLLPLRHAVVATGSGTFVDPINRTTILADGATVWLDAPLATLTGRLPGDNRRPLGSDADELAAAYEARCRSVPPRARASRFGLIRTG